MYKYQWKSCSHQKGEIKETDKWVFTTFANVSGHQRGSGKRGGGSRVLPDPAGFTFDLTVLWNKMEEPDLARLSL